MHDKSPGRPAGPSTARQDLLDAAVHLFAERGYDRTSLRAVTEVAGVDVALVKHYFGNKQGLFEEAVLRYDGRNVDLFNALQSGTDLHAADIAEAYLGIWEEPRSADVVKALLRTALESPDHRDRLQQIVADRIREFSDPDGAVRPGTTSDRNLHLLTSHLLGVGVMRYLLALSPLADLSHEEMVEDLVPVIERYLP